MSERKMYFVRHGESVANSLGVLAGSIDYPLSQLGIEQATALSNLIENDPAINPSLIVSSPLKRALDTAKIIAGTGLMPIVLDNLAAASGGDLEGRPYTKWYEVREQELCDHGAEDARMLYKRAGRAALDIMNFHNNMPAGDTIIVSHAGLYQMMVAYCQKLYPETLGYNIKKPTNGQLVELNLLAEGDD